MQIVTPSGRLLLCLITVAFMLAYLVVALSVQGENIWRGITALGGSGACLVLALSLVNYLLRYLRWSAFLAVLGHRLPPAPNLASYLAGFAFTASPGKAGEAVRSLFLREQGVGYPQSLAALFTERLLDVLAICLLVAITAAQIPGYRGPAIVAGVLLLALLYALGMPGSRRGVEWLGARLPRRLQGLAQHVGQLVGAAGELLVPRRLYPALAIGMVAWAAEGLGLYWLCRALLLAVSPEAGVAIYSVGILAGAASFFMPAGLGGTEAAMTALLMASGATLSAAVVVTVLCRVATLWFAVILGVAALLWLEWFLRKKAKRPGDACKP